MITKRNGSVPKFRKRLISRLNDAAGGPAGSDGSVGDAEHIPSPPAQHLNVAIERLTDK
jgi:hypothetical protein